MRRLPILLAAMLLTGCAGWRDPAPLAAEPLELREIPFFPQQDHQCGPAALATVLGASGVSARPEELVAATYLPAREGALQVELVAAARHRGRLAVEVEGTPQAIVAQLAAGRPVLVLQNLALRIMPVWHYAVVVGYRPDDDRFVLRSGRERRALLRYRRFESTWARGGNWGVVLLAPTAQPTGLAPGAYLQAAADLESTGAHGIALEAFESALGAWPQEPNARLGQANNLYYLGRLDEAAEAYRALLAAHPDHEVALHNLTMLLLEQDRACQARALLAGAPGAGGALLETARRAVAAAVSGNCGA